MKKRNNESKHVKKKKKEINQLISLESLVRACLTITFRVKIYVNNFFIF